MRHGGTTRNVELRRCLPSIPYRPPARSIRAASAERHSHLLSGNRVAWALRNRRTNGLNTADAVFDSPCDELLIREPAFLNCTTHRKRTIGATVVLVQSAPTAPLTLGERCAVHGITREFYD